MIRCYFFWMNLFSMAKIPQCEQVQGSFDEVKERFMVPTEQKMTRVSWPLGKGLQLKQL